MHNYDKLAKTKTKYLSRRHFNYRDDLGHFDREMHNTSNLCAFLKPLNAQLCTSNNDSLTEAWNISRLKKNARASVEYKMISLKECLICQTADMFHLRHSLFYKWATINGHMIPQRLMPDQSKTLIKHPLIIQSKTNPDQTIAFLLGYMASHFGMAVSHWRNCYTQDTRPTERKIQSAI